MSASDLSDDYTVEDAHEFLNVIRPTDLPVLLKAIQAVQMLVVGKGFGCVQVDVHAGALRQVELKQTIRR